MRREIKFRAWDKQNNGWFKPTYEAYKGNLEELLVSPSGRLSLRTLKGVSDESVFLDRFVLMQYTGLKDKNGKEIYEGDVVRSVRRYPINSETAKKFNHYVGQIYYDVELGSWWITTNPTNGFDHEHTCQEATSHAFEAIGNIYENPELLEDTKGE